MLAKNSLETQATEGLEVLFPRKNRGLDSSQITIHKLLCGKKISWIILNISWCKGESDFSFTQSIVSAFDGSLFARPRWKLHRTSYFEPTPFVTDVPISQPSQSNLTGSVQSIKLTQRNSKGRIPCQTATTVEVCDYYSVAEARRLERQIFTPNSCSQWSILKSRRSPMRS